MNIETTKISQPQFESQKNIKATEKNSEINFSDELKELEKNQQKLDNNLDPEKEQENSSKEELIKNNKSEDKKINNAIDNLKNVVEKLSQSDDKEGKNLKNEIDLADKQNMINNDFNIQDKDLLPQMNPNMNFSGDGQPFSSFLNENQNKKQNKTSILGASKKDLAEEAAIMSTMAENIAIANKNKLTQPQKDEIEVLNNNEIKKIDIKTQIVTETIIKFDSIIMNQADVEVFADLVQKSEANLNNLAPEAAAKSIQVSKTLADLLAKSMEKNQPLRIDFDNNISVIIRISRDGKISADFLPSTQIAEAYLKENLPLLRQKFDDNNIDYESLNQRERRENPKENNRKKGRNNE